MARLLPIWILVVQVALLAQTVGLPNATVSRLNRPRGDSIIGNGVDAGTGAFLFARQLLAVKGNRTLDFPVTYNSMLAQTRGTLGFGWSHPYEARISGDPSSTVTVHWDAQRLNSFSFAGTGNPYQPLDEAVLYDRLTRNTAGTWRLVRHDGTIYDFEANGRLRQLGNKIFQFLEMGYDSSGRLASIREPVANRLLTLSYQNTGSNLLESVRDGADRTVFFEYDANARLIALRAPVELGDGVAPQVFDPRDIPDNNPQGLVYTIEVGRSTPIGLVKLFQTSITHSRPSDLNLFLISPRGTRVEIPQAASERRWQRVSVGRNHSRLL